MRKLTTAVLASSLLLLRPGGAEADEPSGEILFYSEARGPGQLYIVELSGNEVRAVGRSGARPDHYPQWSPDGERIVFESYREGGWHSWVMDADGGNARRASDLPGSRTRHYEFDASFAPDNRSIVFVTGFDLHTVTPTSPTPRPVGAATPLIYESAPVYSPDMRRIAFEATPSEGGSAHIFTVDTDGGGRRQITSGAGNHRAPVWSPSGERLLFYSDRDGSAELYDVGVDGGAIRRVLQPSAAKGAGFTHAAPVDPWDNDNGATMQYRASYSPDGRWIAFSRDVDGDRELFVSDVEGTKIRRITFQKGHDGFPGWRPRSASPTERRD